MQRKATKQSRGPNQAEKDFQAWLKQQPCCITGDYGVEVHHCKGSTFKHNKVLIGHWFCIPLRPDIHKEYHAGTKAWREKYGYQSAHWMSIHGVYHIETGNRCPNEVEEAILFGRF